MLLRIVSCLGRGNREAMRRRAGASRTVLWVPVQSASQTCRARPGRESTLSSYRTAPSGRCRSGAARRPRRPRWDAGKSSSATRSGARRFRFHGLGPDEAQIGFHAGETVGRERGALLEEHPDLVVPIDIVEREGDKPKLFGLLGIERRRRWWLARDPDRTDRPGSAIAAGSGRGSSDRARNSSRRARSSAAARLSPCFWPISM